MKTKEGKLSDLNKHKENETDRVIKDATKEVKKDTNPKEDRVEQQKTPWTTLQDYLWPAPEDEKPVDGKTHFANERT